MSNQMTLERELAMTVDDQDRRPATVFVDLYHRTTPERAALIMATGRMISLENTGEAYFSNRPDGFVLSGYGEAVVHVRVPEALAELEDEFPDGERHYRVRVAALRPEYFIR